MKNVDGTKANNIQISTNVKSNLTLAKRKIQILIIRKINEIFNKIKLKRTE